MNRNNEYYHKHAVLLALLSVFVIFVSSNTDNFCSHAIYTNFTSFSRVSREFENFGGVFLFVISFVNIVLTIAIESKIKQRISIHLISGIISLFFIKIGSNSQIFCSNSLRDTRNVRDIFLDSAGVIAWVFCVTYSIQMLFQWTMHLGFLLMATTRSILLLLSYVVDRNAFVIESLQILFTVASLLFAILSLRRAKSPSILPGSFEVVQTVANTEEMGNNTRSVVSIVIFLLCDTFISIMALTNIIGTNIVGIRSILRLTVLYGFVYPFCKTELSKIDQDEKKKCAVISAQAARKAFMRFVFHELRNPLNSLALSVNFIRSKGIIDEAIVIATTAMEESVCQMSNVMDDILTLQSVEEGTLQLRTKEFRLREVIINTLQTLIKETQRKFISFSLDFRASVPLVVTGDQDRLEYIIFHMLITITEYSKTNTKLQVAVDWVESMISKETTEAKQCVMFEINNEGPSIPYAELSMQLKPFSYLRGHSERERYIGSGNGLGLALARDLVEANGGEFIVLPHIGDTVKLGFKLPLTQIVPGEKADDTIIISELSNSTLQNEALTILTTNQKSDEYRGLESPKPMEFSSSRLLLASGIKCFTSLQSPRSRLETEKHETSQSVNSKSTRRETRFFLVVDDVLANRKILAMLLKNSGFSSDQAENGFIAVNMVKMNPNKYICIFMDQTMPIMDGVEATKLIRESGFRNFIFGLTGNTMDDDIQKLSAAGADIVIPKPIRPRQLKSIIEYIHRFGHQSNPDMRLVFDDDELKDISE